MIETKERNGYEKKISNNFNGNDFYVSKWDRDLF